MTRVLHVVWEYPPVVYGGLARHAEQLTRAQARAGLQVGVLTLAEDVTDRARRVVHGDRNRFGVRVRRVRRPPSRTPWSDLIAAADEAEQALAQGGTGLAPDVVHAHDWVGSRAAAGLAERAGVPLVLTVHATEGGRQHGRLDGNPVAQRVHQLEREAVAAADAVVACSTAMRAEVVELLGADPARVRVVPNAVDVASWRVGRPTALRRRRVWLDGGSGPLVVAAGRLEWEKGFSTLIRAIPWLRQRFPGLRVVLAGRGSYAGRLHELADELGVLDVLMMPGWLPSTELASLFAGCDAVVVPSRYEPSGLVAREAQAAGAPVVATPVGGLAEAVDPGRTGLRVGVGDVHGLQEALASLVADPACARALAEAGRAAVTRWTWADAAEALSAIYAR